MQGVVGEPLTGLPPVVAYDEGGLLDVVLDPAFDTNRLIYWSYSEPAGSGEHEGRTAVARGRLSETGVSDVSVLVRQVEVEEDGKGATTNHVVLEVPQSAVERRRVFLFEQNQAESEGFEGVADRGQRYLYMKLC